MDLADLRYERDTHQPHLAWITLDRPAARNAWSDPMLTSFLTALDTAERDPDVRVVALTGTGRSFSAGGDIKAMRDRSGMFAGEATELRDRYIRGIQQIPRRLLRFPKPVIAAINGHAIGAGFDLTCMCDLRVASDTAKMGSTFVKLGLIPGDGGAYLLARLIGLPHASELVLTGRVIDATEAHRIGLVNHVVPPEELATRVRALADEITRNAPIAVRLAKGLLRQAEDQTLDGALDLAATYQGIAQTTADHAEGLSAMLERRPPRFEDR
jgi:2-(1,2-epoxy-1,2-dihydrophenyl)acetyl-CoA isomerase